MNSNQTTTATQLLAAIPSLIGFIPERSLVVIGMHDGRVASPTARHDLAIVGEGIAAVIADAVASAHVRHAYVITIDDTDTLDNVHPASRTMGNALDAAGIRVTTIQTTTVADAGHRWIDHTNKIEGHTRSYLDSPATAAAVARGRRISPSRRAEAEMFAKYGDPATIPNPETLDNAAIVGELINVMHGRATVDEDLAAAVAAIVRTGPLKRDALLYLAMLDTRAGAETFRQCAVLLTGQDLANVMTIAVAAYYADGGGAMVNHGLDAITAEQETPISFAQLLDTASRSGVHPDHIKEAINTAMDATTAADQLGIETFPTYE